MKWCKGEYTIFYLYLKVRKKIPYKVYDTDLKVDCTKEKSISL